MARSVLYCIVPAHLAAKLHEPLRRHFREDSQVEVIVEQRSRGRRRNGDRRGRASREIDVERRRIKASEGRRVTERRSTLIDLRTPPLPRRFRRFAEELAFVERLEPTPQEAEDADTARLVTRIQSGDRDAFSLLYLRYFDRVYSYLRVALTDDARAEDATQEVFIRVFKALPQYERRRQPFRAWLFVIVRHHALGELRKEPWLDLVGDDQLARVREGGGDDWDRTVLGWISDRELMMFIERLPLAQRQVLVLRYLLDLEMTQIAEIMGRADADVRMLHHRAVRFLKDRLSAVGRTSITSRRAPMCRGRKQYGVLRARRWALMP